MKFKITLLCFILVQSCSVISAQKNTLDSVLTSNDLVKKIAQFPTKQLNNTYSRFDRQLTKSLNKYLSRIEKKESVLKKKLASTDSFSANKLFNASASKINEFRLKLDSPLLGLNNRLGVNYKAKLDSLHTLSGFFSTRE